MGTATRTAEQHIDAAKRRLAHLGGLSARTAETERRILAAASERLSAVEADIATLRPRALIDHAAGDRYQALALERGQIETVIGRARAALA